MAVNLHCNTRITLCLALAMLCVPLQCVALSHPTPLHPRARIRRGKVGSIEGVGP